MKLLKSSLIKKLIIILIALMIFNIAVPKQTQAVDLAGWVLKPLTEAVLGVMIAIDATIGIVLNGFSIKADFVGALVEEFKDMIDHDAETRLGDYNSNYDKAMKKLFVGPDTIFAGQIKMLNANIFDRSDMITNPPAGSTETELETVLGGLQNATEAASEWTSPRIYINY